MENTTGNLIARVNSGILVHGCNAQGVMGSGFAQSLKEQYPENYQTYRSAYLEAKEEGRPCLPLGKVVWHVVNKEAPKFVIANAITQEFFGKNKNIRYVDYEAVDTAFRNIGNMARKYDLAVHYPLIGAGLANGSWDIIAPIIDKNLVGVEHKLWIRPGFPVPELKKTLSPNNSKTYRP